MITRDWVRLMAAYNSEMNRRIYAAAAQLTDEERRTDRGAFFGSLHGTLSHLVWGDYNWMARFAGWQPMPGGIPGSPNLFDSWDQLCEARTRGDAGIESWAAGLEDAWLRGPLVWVNSAGTRNEKPAWLVVTHFFNHQTHHRGQAHGLLTRAGVKPADTDLPWVVDAAALGIGAG